MTSFNKELCSSTKPASTTEEKKVFPCIPKGRGIFLTLKLSGNVLGVLWASMVAQLEETQVQSLGWEGLLEKEMATHSSTLA